MSQNLKILFVLSCFLLPACAAVSRFQEEHMPPEPPKILEPHQYPCKQPHTHGRDFDVCAAQNNPSPQFDESESGEF